MNRVQTLRSSTAGNRPTGRQPGELYVNFPDLQLGVINASSTAQDLLGVRLFSSTTSYTVGSFVVQAGNIYQATVAVSAGAFNPAQWAQVAVGGGIAGDNRLINGDMRIDQRNNGASGTGFASQYTVDRWMYNAIAGIGTWGRNYGGGTGPSGFPYYLGFQSTSAYTLVAGDAFTISQRIEADAVSDFAWGAVGAQSATLSFWAFSSLTGAFGGSIRNAAATRSYPFTFSLPTANTWTRIVVTIPGDTGGTWVMSGNARSVDVVFDLGAEPTYRGSANTWASTNYVGVTGAVSVVTVNGASFFLTGVKLEIGSVATPFNRQSLAKSMADCQRYFLYDPASISVGFNSWTAGGFLNTPIAFPTTMRATPTIVLGTSSGNSNVSTVNAQLIGLNSFMFNVASVAAGGAGIAIAYFSANAEL